MRLPKATKRSTPGTDRRRGRGGMEMGIGGRRVVWLLLILILWPALVIADSSVRFAVRDSVQMADFTRSATFSPDRRYFAIVTERGVLPEGVQEATIWLFNSSE